MVKIPGMLKENTDYEMIAGENDHWNIRIMTGEFIESVMSFGKIKVGKDDLLHFDFEIHSSPNDEVSPDNVDFQRYAGKILEAVMVNSLSEEDKEDLQIVED